MDELPSLLDAVKHLTVYVIVPYVLAKLLVFNPLFNVFDVSNGFCSFLISQDRLLLHVSQLLMHVNLLLHHLTSKLFDFFAQPFLHVVCNVERNMLPVWLVTFALPWGFSVSVPPPVSIRRPTRRRRVGVRVFGVPPSWMRPVLLMPVFGRMASQISSVIVRPIEPPSLNGLAALSESLIPISIFISPMPVFFQMSRSSFLIIHDFPSPFSNDPIIALVKIEPFSP